MKNSLCSIRRLLALCTTVALFSTYAIPASAGLFSVSPVRIYMTPKDRAIAVTITNDGDEELVMQADIYSWKQKPNGEDDLTLSEDLFLSPPIIKLAPKARQVVRLAVLTPTKSNDELTYRLIIREVPEVKPVKENVALEIALAFSMPVFITPKTAKSDISCTAERLAANTIKATCENKGNAYVHPREFALKNSAGAVLASRDSGGYILPGIKRSFDIKAASGNIAGGKAKLSITLDDTSTKDFEVNLAN
jgi:fimbrial chaperone protein